MHAHANLGTAHRGLLRALDLPARQAVELGGRSIGATLAPAIAGFGLITIAASVAALIDFGRPSLGLPRLDSLRAGLEAVLVVGPALVIAALYLGLRITPRTLIAGLSIGLFTGGFVSISIVPLMTFFALVERTREGLQFALSPLVPTIALVAVSAVVSRVLTTIDPSARALWVGRAFMALLFSVFVFRFLSHATFLAMP